MKMTELSNEELMCELLLEIRKQLNSTKSDLAKADSLTIEILNRLSRISRLEAENKELKDDMLDYSFIVGEVAKVYDHITNGKLSKPNYHSEIVIAISDDVNTENFAELLKEETEELQQQITDLTKENKELRILLRR